MKRQRAEREEAGISKLPAPILQHILTFLPRRKAIQTCLVSKSWRYLGSTLPKLSLGYYNESKKKFMHVIEKSLQVYLDQKLLIEDLSLSNMPMGDPELVSLLDHWVPILIKDIGVRKLSFSCLNSYSAYYDLPAVVFQSESLQEINLERCKLSKINCIGNVNCLKTLCLSEVDAEEESLANILSSCPLIERFSVRDCSGSFRTIKMHDLHNLKKFDLYQDIDSSNIEIYLPSSIGDISIDGCPNWFHNRTYFPGLTCLELEDVPLSNEWFVSFSRNFPCLEDLKLEKCNGFDELKLSSRSIKKLRIWLDESTTKATIDAPSIKEFFFDANISQSISFTTTSREWKSHIELSLDLDGSLCFLKQSELITAFSQSQFSLVLDHSGGWNDQRISDISFCCSGGSHRRPVAVKSLGLNLKCVYKDSFVSDLVNGLFGVMRPREIILDYRYFEFLCGILQLGRSEDEGMRSFWQEDLEEVSLEVHVYDHGVEEWRPVPGTVNWSEYVKEKHKNLRFRLRWRESCDQ